MNEVDPTALTWYPGSICSLTAACSGLNAMRIYQQLVESPQQNLILVGLLPAHQLLRVARPDRFFAQVVVKTQRCGNRSKVSPKECAACWRC